MRIIVLSITAVLVLTLAASTARAQESIPDPYWEALPLAGDTEAAPAEAPYIGRFQPAPIASLRSRNGFSLPLGPVRLLGRGSSYYPGGSTNLKVRNESLHFAWALSERTDFTAGAWRFKLHQEGLEQMRELTVGIGFIRRF